MFAIFLSLARMSLTFFYSVFVSRKNRRADTSTVKYYSSRQAGAQKQEFLEFMYKK